MDIYQGVQSVAAHCGVKPDDVHRWLKKHGPEGTGLMPAPAVAVKRPSGRKGLTRSTYGWAVDQLEEIRQWALVYYPQDVDQGMAWKYTDEL